MHKFHGFQLCLFFTQLIYEAVNSRFNQLFNQFCGGSSTFLEKTVVLHLAYAELEPQLQQFQQLVSLSPKIVSSVYKKLKEDKDSDFKNEISVSTYFNLLCCRVVIHMI